MPQLIWSPNALRDVARLHAFLKPKNRNAARRAVAAIREGVRLLERHPEAGRPVEDIEPEFREWLIEFGSGGYLALYRFDDAEVILLAVRLHERQGIEDCPGPIQSSGWRTVLDQARAR